MGVHYRCLWGPCALELSGSNRSSFSGVAFEKRRVGEGVTNEEVAGDDSFVQPDCPAARLFLRNSYLRHVFSLAEGAEGVRPLYLTIDLKCLSCNTQFYGYFSCPPCSVRYRRNVRICL